MQRAAIPPAPRWAWWFALAALVAQVSCAAFDRISIEATVLAEPTIGQPVAIHLILLGSQPVGAIWSLDSCGSTTGVTAIHGISLRFLGLSAIGSGKENDLQGSPDTVGEICLRIEATQLKGHTAANELRISVHPALNQLSLQTAPSGSPAFTLRVNGNGFGTFGATQSTVRWNGSPRTTRIISITQLEADITAADLATPGTAQVSVDNGPAGGGLANVVPLATPISQSLPFTITGVAPLPGPMITTTTLPSGVVGVSYNSTLQATGGVGVLTWSLVVGSALPPGLALSAAGAITGTPTTAASANVTFEVRDAANATASRTLAITIAPAPAPPLQITTLSLPNASEHGNYSQTVRATGGTPPYTFSISAGALPNNVVLDSNLGILNGLQPSGGTHTFTVRVQDSASPQQTASQQYTILIIAVTAATLPDAIVGQPYGHTFSVIGDVPPVTWSLAPGSTMPAGFNISSAGVFSGTAPATGTFPFCARVTDSDAPPRFDQECFSLTANNPVPSLTTLTPATAAPGAPAFILTLDGTGFVAASVVRWNSVARPASFVSSTRLTATIPDTHVAAAGIASVTVFNPTPGGGSSNVLTFTIVAPPPPPPPGNGAGVTDLVSQSSLSVPSNAGSAISGTTGRLIAISQNGNRVVFASEGTNLDGPDEGVFVRDIALGVTRHVSTTLLGANPTAIVGESVSISRDGFVVAFESRSNNHVAGDTGQDSDVFVVNTCIQPPGSPPVNCNPSGADWVSAMPDGTEPVSGGSGGPSLSSTGRFVAFYSNAPLTGGSNGSSQIFLRDRQTNVTTMVSVDDTGNAGIGDSFHPSISGNGRFIAFVSNAFNLIAADTNNRPDVFVHDTCFGAPGPCTPSTTRVSVATGDVEAIGGGMFDLFPPSISEDARFVVFASSATNLIPGGTTGIHIFRHDRLDSPLATTARVSLLPTGAPAGFAIHPTISSDGRFVAFESGQAFVHDTCFNTAACTPSSFLVSRVPNGPTANAASAQPAISSDGRSVVFVSPATNLRPGVTTGIAHVYRALTSN